MSKKSTSFLHNVMKLSEEPVVEVLLEKELTGTEPDFIVKLKSLYKACNDIEMYDAQSKWTDYEIFRLYNEMERARPATTLSREMFSTESMLFYLSMYFPDLGMPNKEYYLGITNDSVADTYFKLMVASANWHQLIGANKTTSEEELRKVFNFEITLANFSAQDPRYSYNETYSTVKQLMIDAPQINIKGESYYDIQIELAISPGGSTRGFEYGIDEYTWQKTTGGLGIDFTALVLQPPYFDKDRSNYLNFGALGSLVGYEVTSIFDNKNPQDIVNSWTTESDELFEEKSQCFTEQYCNYTDKHGLMMNVGAKGLATNFVLSYHGGLKAAYLFIGRTSDVACAMEYIQICMEIVIIYLAINASWVYFLALGNMVAFTIEHAMGPV
ncbi:uncharacterized protein LOC118191465 [Stegodyphus dumicola]|uniref:uncharacterized protein LOC118191465 n=1 Tax=Stegodyphus dumicola TaxID=202533 RepID=UPI0015AAC836|nr:uncharacterized protein LOC118191465 [Stegodyphus dumicola]